MGRLTARASARSVSAVSLCRKGSGPFRRAAARGLSSVAGAALVAGGLAWAGPAAAQSATTAPAGSSSASWPASSQPAMTTGPGGEIALDAITVVATYTPISTINALAGVSTVRLDQLQEYLPDRTADVFWACRA